MALLLGGMKCSICGETLRDGEPIFGTWGTWLPDTDPLFPFCDAALHWSCYATWPHRERFASTYFDFWVGSERQDLWWHRAYFDGDVLVTVNPVEPVRSAWIHLRPTGTRTSVRLTDWAGWVGDSTRDGSEHPLLAETLREAKQRLRVALPTEQAVLDNLDLARKQLLFERHRAAEEERKAKGRAVQTHVNAHNAACNRLMRAVERDGFTCPHCAVTSKDFRLAKRANQRSAIICKTCGWTVEPPKDAT